MSESKVNPWFNHQLYRESLRNVAPFMVPNVRAQLEPLEVRQVVHDGVDNAYNQAELARWHHILASVGHFKLPIKTLLTRQDFDLIHNYIAPKLSEISKENSSVADAFYRLLVKANELRDWSDKVKPDLFPPMPQPGPAQTLPAPQPLALPTPNEKPSEGKKKTV